MIDAFPLYDKFRKNCIIMKMIMQKYHAIGVDVSVAEIKEC